MRREHEQKPFPHSRGPWFSSLLLLALLAFPACDPTGCGGAPGVGGDAGDVGDAGNAPGGDAGDEPPAATPVALELSPGDVLLETAGGSRPTQAFSVEMQLDDGTTVDVTHDTELTVEDTRLGSFTENVFTSAGIVGETRVVARRGDLEGSARLVVRKGGTFTEAPPAGARPLPGSPDDVLEEAPVDEARAPTIVYPADGVLLPPNLRGLEIQFLKGSERNTLFAVRFASEDVSLRVYMRCTPLEEGCVYVPDAHVWSLITEAHAGEGPIAVTVIGTDDAGNGAGESAPVSLSFTESSLAGGLYYWTTSGSSAIMRVDFESDDQLPEAFFAMEDGSCVGCHALSPDGRKMTLSGEDQTSDGKLMVLDVENSAVLVPQSPERLENFQAWDPTSSFFAGVYAFNETHTTIRIRDGATATLLDEIDVGMTATHPDWAATGDRIYFTSPTRNHDSLKPLGGGLWYIEQEAGAWGPPEVLVPAAHNKNRYYPAASPDGSIVAFNESDCYGGFSDALCDTIVDPTATLWAVAADGGAPVLLERATHAGTIPGSGGSPDSYPKWAPFLSSARDSERVLWLSFASRRKVGLRDPGGSTWLWMVAVDPDRVLAGEDGSYAAFVLPMQDFETSNHIGQWTQEVVKPE